MPRRRLQEAEYPKQFRGYYGSMGQHDLKVSYIQTVLELKDLDAITLVDKIPGSELWGIRELFQRIINIDRVDRELIPYFKNDVDIKFFNPLTLSILPMSGHHVTNDFKEDESEYTDDDKFKFKLCEAKSFYQLHHCETDRSYSKIKWNEDNCRLIAIDGQHRLKALKTLYERYKSASDNQDLVDINFDQWTIPAIIAIMPTHPYNPNNISDKFDFLSSIRKIFININKEAKAPSRTQNIILDDTSITAICCQETLQISQDKKSDIPIEFYDWRTKKPDEKNREVESKMAFLRIDELEDLFMKYLLGEDERVGLSSKQEIAFNIGELDPPLNTSKYDWQNRFRDIYKELWYKAFEKIICNFIPVKLYLDKIIKLKQEIISGSSEDNINAMNYITYGTKPSDSEADSTMSNALKDIEKKCNSFKTKPQFKDLFNRLIGLRGIFSGFGHIYYDWYVKNTDFTPGEVAEDYINSINKAYNKDYLNLNEKCLTFFVKGHDGNIGTLYKLDTVNKRFGIFCAQLHLVQLFNSETDATKKEAQKKIIDKYSSKIEKILEGGFKSEAEYAIKKKNPNIGALDLKEQKEAYANEEVPKRQKLLEQLFNLDK